MTATDRLNRLQAAVDTGVDGLGEVYKLLNALDGWKLSPLERDNLEKAKKVLAEVAKYLGLYSDDPDMRN